VGPRPDLIFFNGLGGFTPDGREYVITTTPGRVTPAPWVNVLANPQFGPSCQKAAPPTPGPERARIPFDPLGERPDQRRLRGSPVPARRGQWPVLVPDYPALSGSPDQPTVARHGFGYSVFEHSEGGIHSELWIYVDVECAGEVLGAQAAQ